MPMNSHVSETNDETEEVFSLSKSQLVQSVSTLVLFWVIGCWGFAANDGFAVWANPDAGRFAQLLPLALIGLIPFTVAGAHALVTGGRTLKLTASTITIYGAFAIRVIEADRIASIQVHHDDRSFVRKLVFIAKDGRPTTVHWVTGEISAETLLEIVMKYGLPGELVQK
jgi:uncharacterized membrane protein (DUF2068 family)